MMTLESNRLRLAEAIAWCGLQKLINKPLESKDVKRRRVLGERAANDAFAAHQLDAASVFKWINRKKVKQMQQEASQMLAEAQLDTIRPLAEQLRTPVLQPTTRFEGGQTEGARAAIVDAVCEARARLLHERGIDVGGSALDLAEGKILLYAPRGKLADGSPGYESKGFFDWECAPPWDTWVCYDGGRLVAYVPRILCGIAQSGLEVDPAECLRWANSSLITETFGPTDAAIYTRK